MGEKTSSSRKLKDQIGAYLGNMDVIFLKSTQKDAHSGICCNQTEKQGTKCLRSNGMPSCMEETLWASAPRAEGRQVWDEWDELWILGGVLEFNRKLEILPAHIKDEFRMTFHGSVSSVLLWVGNRGQESNYSSCPRCDRRPPGTLWHSAPWGGIKK